jgi:hypothetical protein
MNVFAKKRAAETVHKDEKVHFLTRRADEERAVSAGIGNACLELFDSD